MLLSIYSFLSVCTLVFAAEGFHPRSYTKQTASCSAWHRNGGQGEPTETVINMSYVDINPTANRTLLLVHGWPGLWTIWSNQILHFQDKYRIIAVDMRGFGDSTHPGDVQASGTHGDLVGDLICVLQNAGVEKAVCIGHDWGAQICYEAARMRPEYFEGVVGSALPYVPSHADELTSVEALSKALPKLTYQQHFEKRTSKAVAELNQDHRRTIRATLRSVTSPPPDGFLRSPTSFLRAYDRDMPDIPPVPFFTEEEEDYYVEQYQKQGFDNTLQFYTYENRYRTWELSHQQGNFTIAKPVLAIYPTADPVADWPLIALIVGSAKHLPYLTTRALVTAHWVHLERPVEFNQIVDEWLVNLDVGLLEAKLGELNKEVKAVQKEIASTKERIRKERKSRKP